MSQNNNENNGNNIEFQDTGWKRTTGQRQSFETPKIIQWVIKYSGGLIKNEKQAQYALLGFIIAAVIISFLITFKRSSRKLETEEKSFLNTGGSTESYDTKLFSQ